MSWTRSPASPSILNIIPLFACISSQISCSCEGAVTESDFSQPVKASGFKTTVSCGKTNFSSAVHSWNAPSDTTLRFSGSFTDFNDLHSEKTYSLSSARPSSVTDSRPVQPENAPLPSSLTFAGTVMLLSPVQPENALCPMFFIMSFKASSESAMQPEKAPSPMKLRASGKLIFSRASQFEKAYEYILVAFFGKITVLSARQPQKQ